jgi:hypothetical protein
VKTKFIYNLYLSHSWNYNHAYKKLSVLLSSSPDFHYNRYFFTEQDPVGSTRNERELYDAIKLKMKYSHAALLMCGVYSTYSRWVNKEIIICKNEFNKPLIAIEPFDSSRTSAIVKQHADRIVGWNIDTIVNTVKELS